MNPALDDNHPIPAVEQPEHASPEPIPATMPSSGNPLTLTAPEPIASTTPPLNDQLTPTTLDKMPPPIMATGPPESVKDVEVEMNGAGGADDDGSDDEEGFIDGVPEDLADYIDVIWEFLVGASGSDDWVRAMKLWARLEKRLDYPQGRVSNCLHLQ